jgi:predicted transcriptional regulator
MAKASQSNGERGSSERPGSGGAASRPASRRTKLPEFDPSELDDLIFTPAVGSGVGSHLLQHEEPTETLPDGRGSDLSRDREGALSIDQSTVDTSTVVDTEVGTVAEHEPTTVVAFTEPVLIEQVAEQPTVVQLKSATVVEPATGADEPTVDDTKSPTVDVSTVVAPISLWLSESGEIVPASRVKRIRLAQDVLSPAEESVYDTLWGVKTAAAFKEEGESYRIVQAGYDFLMKRTRLSKKTIQRIVDRLIDKGFIAIEKPADIYLRSSTVYRVFAYRAVLDRQAQNGRFHVAKIGPGFVYVREVADPRRVAPSNVSTVVDSVPSTVAGMHQSTASDWRASTGAVDRQTTVVTVATNNIEQKSEGSASSSEGAPAPAAQGREVEVRELRALLERYLGFLDDDAARQLLRQCRLRAADCTLEEIAYFVSHKLRSVNGIHNPVGFILTAVPRHFENNGHGAVRAFLKEEQERRRRVWQEEYRYWRAIVEDSESSPEERTQAAEVIASLEKSADRA